jgi:putative phosphoesterase
MKIALFSDVHANLPALEACLKSIDSEEPDVVYCLGDLVGYNVWPNEVIREIRRRRIPTIKGNYDEGIGAGSSDCGCAYKTAEEKQMGAVSISYTNAIVGDAERAFLHSLPAHLMLQFKSNGCSFNVLLVHGSPRKVNEYLFEDREEQSLLRILEGADAQVLVFGHTHKPFHRVLPTAAEGKKGFIHAVNIGSVGKPKDGNAEGCYVVLQVDERTTVDDPGSLTVTFKRFTYDVEAAARGIEASPLPNAYADMLRKGY